MPIEILSPLWLYRLFIEVTVWVRRFVGVFAVFVVAFWHVFEPTALRFCRPGPSPPKKHTTTKKKNAFFPFPSHAKP